VGIGGIKGERGERGCFLEKRIVPLQGVPGGTVSP